MLLRPLPVPLPHDLVAVGFRTETMPGVTTITASYPEYEDARSRVRSFEGLLAREFAQVGFAPQVDVPSRVRFASFVSENFFTVLGVPPALGRGFHADETAPRSPARVVILSDSVWRGDYGGDQHVVGRTLRVRGTDFTIVGVVPLDLPNLHPIVREALFLRLGILPSLVDMLPSDVLEKRNARVFTLKGRLRPTVTLAEARTELRTIGQAPLSVTADGAMPQDAIAWRPVRANEVDDSYFAAMNIRMVAGRSFTPADDTSAAPVAIVNTVLAENTCGPARIRLAGASVCAATKNG